MNVYDKAHELAKALKDSEEFKDYKEKHEKVMSDPNKAERINSYREKIINFQVENMGKEDYDKEALEKIQELQKSLFMDRDISEFMEAESKFARIYNEINNIISQAISIENEEN